MGRLWRPILVGALVIVGVFMLAKAQVFEPSASSTPTLTGDPARGATVFSEKCAACHGAGGVGGTGPTLVGSRLTTDQVTRQVRQGGGIMPAGLVIGQDEADVVAYVVSIAAPG